jgi:hypothetical protein
MLRHFADDPGIAGKRAWVFPSGKYPETIETAHNSDPEEGLVLLSNASSDLDAVIPRHTWEPGDSACQ